MEDHIPERPDKSIIGRHTSKWSLWDVVFIENNSTCKSILNTLVIMSLFVGWCIIGVSGPQQQHCTSPCSKIRS